MENRDIVYILWTGGWDSTFRILQLAEKDIIVQPIYIYSDRGGAVNELKSIKQVICAVSDNKNFKAEVRNCIIFDKRVIMSEYEDKEIISARERLTEKYNLGYQYDWFALLAKHLNKKLEVCVELSEHSKAHRTLNNEGKLIDIGDGRKIIDIDNSSEDLIKVFDYAIFPTLQYSKVEMKRISKEKGWYDIMKMTWFCHRPVNNKPCGNCNPCRDAMNEGMSFRMPLISKFRYYYYNASLKKFLTSIFSIKNEFENDKKYKIITILGFKIKILKGEK